MMYGDDGYCHNYFIMVRTSSIMTVYNRRDGLHYSSRTEHTQTILSVVLSAFFSRQRLDLLSFEGIFFIFLFALELFYKSQNTMLFQISQTIYQGLQNTDSARGRRPIPGPPRTIQFWILPAQFCAARSEPIHFWLRYFWPKDDIILNDGMGSIKLCRPDHCMTPYFEDS